MSEVQLKEDKKSESAFTSMGKPRVLVLLATYNAAPWLVEQLNSILVQVDVDVHVLIGDDCSKDETRELIRSEWQGDMRIELLEWSTPSGSAGANFRRLYRHANASNYDFVALADQDDIWLPAKLISAIRCLSAQSAAGYSCSVESFWPDGQKKLVKQSSTVRNADFLFEGAGQGCTFVLTQTLFLRLQAFCERHPVQADAMHYHDWLVYLLARVSGLTWYFDETPYMRYRQHAGNEIGSRGSVSAVTKRLELIKNGWYRKQVLAALEIATRHEHMSSSLARFAHVFQTGSSAKRRVYLAWFLFAHGRRKLSDRVVLSATALLGWI